MSVFFYEISNNININNINIYHINNEGDMPIGRILQDIIYYVL